MKKRISLLFDLVLVFGLLIGLHSRFVQAADEFESAPIRYSLATPDDPVSRLQQRLELGELELKVDPKFGYLPDLLQELQIPVDSQLLVYSKTSQQRHRINPRTPRALYFNDEVYVGYCHAGELIEISSTDPRLGTVFYTLKQGQEFQPRLVRETDRCLQCHSVTQSSQIPGHLIRSLFVDAGGQPLFNAGSHSVNHSTPIADRWGGWYVTGTHGEQKHRGNLIVRGRTLPDTWDNEAGHNVQDLRSRFNVENYLTPHSDLAALMVFEHQAYVQNLLTAAHYTAQRALYYESEYHKAFNEGTGEQLESTKRRIENAGEKLVQGLLMCDEALLLSPMSGTTDFAGTFSQRGPIDSQGRSLRQLDLQRRLFRYPCSYLIYSPQFASLPPIMKNWVTGRLKEILAGNGGEKYEYLSPADRDAIREILASTIPELWSSTPP
ncbi:hypothetical protein [Planctomicrobium sp. SH664]|uniref:hypothetical protein n=1 Tax=Planctomicrobium sp. SH664 TaxID=3448125 RepID=UPI003F5B6931